MMNRILVTEPEYFDREAISILSKSGQVIARRLDRRELARIIPKIDAIVVRVETHLDSELLRKAKKLKVIGSATTGLNHIDMGHAKRLGIRVVNLHGTHTEATAEFTIALLLALTRKIPWAYSSLDRGEWKRYRFIGTDLYGKTLGILGLGRIGKRVARYAKAFGMEVIAYDPYVSSRSVKMVNSLGALLGRSDVITIHTMLTEETREMTSGKEFRLMKRRPFLINTARGDIVDQDALLAALRSGRIRGAAEDVFPNEPIADKRDRLLAYARNNQNLIVTPHLGASTREAVHSAGIEIARKVSDALKTWPSRPVPS